MLPDPQDTIVALASSPCPGARAIIRLSGPKAFTTVTQVFSTDRSISATERAFYVGQVRVPDLTAFLPADFYFWPAPRTYTGQPMAELHTVSCLPLVEMVVAQLLNAGARSAQPGEFTLRAFLAGKLDLPRAEAVRAIIEAGTRAELKDALAQLAGGITQPLLGLRSELLDLLAEVEAGLDFAEEDIRFVDRTDLLHRLAKGMALLTLARKQIDQRGTGDRSFRGILLGPPNAGKSSLFNALTGTQAALVSSAPGTTRDYLVRRIELEGIPVELVDTAGSRIPTDAIEAQAQSLGQAQAEQADLLLLCLECGKPIRDPEQAGLSSGPPVVIVHTKSDLAPCPPDGLAVSIVTGAGLPALRALLAEWARSQQRPALAPSLGRCRHHVEAALEHLRRAHHVGLFEEPPELLALELRGALDELGEMVGAVYTDDLLDRIFSRFCIGK